MEKISNRGRGRGGGEQGRGRGRGNFGGSNQNERQRGFGRGEENQGSRGGRGGRDDDKVRGGGRGGGGQSDRGGGRGGGQGDRGGRGGGQGRGRGGISVEQKAQITAATRPTTIQVASDGTDDLIVASSAGDNIRGFARMVLTKESFSDFTSRQIREFVNSCLLNLSNHHSVDTSGLLPALASPSGHARLRDILVMPMGIDAAMDKSHISFQFVALPLVGVLTREAVCMSTMGNESNVIYATVYTYRQTFIEEGIIPCVQELLSRGSLADNSPGAAKIQGEDEYLCVVTSLSCALLAIVRLVYQIVTRIRDARTDLADTVKTLAAQVQTCAKISIGTERDQFINGIMVKEVNRLQRIVSDAEDAIIPVMEMAAADRAVKSANIPIMRHLRNSFDPPGTLSADGPRHDNDFSEIPDINILPTQQEITCTRPPFLPSNRVPDAPHFLNPGWKRQVDTHFRLYREDMMDPLRRSITSFLAALEHTPIGEESRLLANKELRKVLDNNVNLNVYGNVQVFGMTMDKNTGGNIEIGFSQPPQILGAAEERRTVERRTEFWKRSKNRLMHGGLICLISRAEGLLNGERDASMPNFQLILAVIAQRDTEELAKNDMEARISITLADPLQYLLLLNSASKTSSKHWFLVESPGAYFGSYRPILKALQLSIPASLPFGKYLAPTQEEQAEIRNIRNVVDLPIYARAPTFMYDLSVLLKGRTCKLDVNNTDSVEQAVRTLQDNSTLDHTQAIALVDTLCREVALINGPPGTGKTWIGIALMQVLLANKAQSECGPILCICYTNHALDQFLEHLLDKDVLNIVRVGARSQSERLEQYNLQALMAVYDKPYQVRQALRATFNDLESAAKKIKDLERDIQGDCVQWKLVQNYLRLDYPDLFDQFKEAINDTHHSSIDKDKKEHKKVDSNEFTKVEGKKSMNEHLFDRWRSGQDIQEIVAYNKEAKENWKNRAKDPEYNTFEILSDNRSANRLQPPVLRRIPSTNRTVDLLLDADIWNMSMNERERLLDQWRPEVQKTLMDRLGELVRHVETLNDKKNGANDEIRRGILRQCSVVGMTTNGAAKSQELIKKLAPKIIICEEAGEVLESHILSALSSSTQHLILIGDHKQLRPQIETYNLSSDSPIGKKYSLDMSLFERLVTSAKNPLPMSILTTQRRMRPCISNLIRQPLYPDLEDGDNVHRYPPICGMGENLYFMHHHHPEDSKDAFGMQSYSSTFEANMARALATYLIKNGYDQPGDIAILTPYLGQLSKLRDALKSSFMLVIDEREQEQLDQKDLEEGGEGQDSVHVQNGTKVGTKNISLQKQLTLRTIDNYQGEEAKIIIISLVRNNVANDPSASGNIGFLKSPNRTNVLLSRAQHGMFIIGNAAIMAHEKNGIWPSVIKELRAHDRVGDGFPLKCKNHPEPIRMVESAERFKVVAPNGGCNLPCVRGMSCGHVCPLQCHPDDGDHRLVKCFQPCNRLQPICQHACPKQCGQLCGDCKEIVGPLLLKCGHILEKPQCHQKKNPSKIVCRVKVTRKLPACEHKHEMQCYQDAAKVVCLQPCASILPCGHSCTKTCTTCQKASLPKTAPKPKSKDQQAKDVPRTNHGQCDKSLPCGHRCPSICGEICPPQKFCVECKDPETMSMEVDMIMMASLGETDVDEDPILVLSCGHALTMTTLDGMMDMSRYYEEQVDRATSNTLYLAKRTLPGNEVKQVSCPSCRKPIMQLLRYGRRIKDAQLSLRLKKYQIIQENGIADIKDQFDDAEAQINMNHKSFMLALSKIQADPCADPPPPESRKLGKFAQESDPFPGSVFWSIDETYGIPPEHREEWAKHIRPAGILNKKLNTINKNAAMSPTKQVFEAAVARLYRLQQESRPTDGTDQDKSPDQDAASAMIQKCILKCGLPADGNGGSSYVESLAEKTNALLLVLSEASSAMEAVGPNTGWYFFVEDLRNCCLAYTHLTMKAAVKGHYERRVAYSRVILLDTLCDQVRWLGLRPVPDEDEDAKLVRFKAIDTLTESFMKELKVLKAHCPLGIKPECLARADATEKRMVTAVKTARGELNAPLTKAEKLQVFRAMAATLGGSGHWYRCPNGHTYVIGECGMAMEQSRCPECGATVGGGSHRLRSDNALDTDYEELYRQPSGVAEGVRNGLRNIFAGNAQ
ncbi:hypothetical protein BGX26_011932 [Mortierella sp. AD094]|nr:hypothetical protein BGX26_011932 [Mortierella sp. AD094]